MKIAIKGHASRGKEVIQILESLGGKNRCPLNGKSTISHYYINYDCNNVIHCHDVKYINEHCKKYTLEEFEKEFPFKIGDKVTIIVLPDFPKIITKMVWDCGEILYSFENLNNTWFSAKSLKKFEMKEERNITLTLDKAKEWYNKGGELKEIALQAFTEKELNPLPRSWEEFCEKYSKIDDKEYFIDSNSSILQVKAVVSNPCRLQNSDRNICPSEKSAEAHLAMMQLEQLRDCWRQGWKPKEHESVYTIKFSVHCLAVYQFNSREFLSFPTKEMAEEFLKCFRDLIEKAGDLI